MPYDNTLGRLPDPTTNPAGPGFTSLSLADNSPGVSHRLNSGGVISVKFAGNYWTINIAFPEMTVAQGNTLLPFLYSVSGGFTDFYVQLPNYKQPQTGWWDYSSSEKVALGSVLRVSPNSVSINNWSSRGGDLSVGDMLKFSNSNKVYLIVGTTLVSNVKTLIFNCDILEPAKLATCALDPNDIKFKVKFEGSVSPVLTSRGTLEGFNLSMSENIL